tara:strand:- start:143 stop:442 length:300 start_codon:yes stop_codon:yes gene_type:complete
MNDKTKMKAESISAPEFVKAYIAVHDNGGTVADLAETLNRDIGQVRAKRNSVAAHLKERGVELPTLKRMERSGMGSVSFDEAAELVRLYTAPPIENSEV